MCLGWGPPKVWLGAGEVRLLFPPGFVSVAGEGGVAWKSSLRGDWGYAL